MNRYTIYCGAKQVKKAIKLGAPVEKKEVQLCDNSPLNYFWYDGVYYNFPTAEQMIGWLEEKGLMFIIATNPFDEFKVIVSKAGGYETIIDIQWSKSRKEAILAAIDLALDYLIKIKK